MPTQRTFYVVQERGVEVAAVTIESALAQGHRAFNAYSIAENPEVKEGPIHIREVVLENLPMYLNLGDMHSLNTVIGRASASKDPQTGASQIVINLAPTEALLLDHLVEIADIKAVGFAGIMKKREIPRGSV